MGCGLQHSGHWEAVGCAQTPRKNIEAVSCCAHQLYQNPWKVPGATARLECHCQPPWVRTTFATCFVLLQIPSWTAGGAGAQEMAQRGQTAERYLPMDCEVALLALLRDWSVHKYSLST